MKTYPFNKSTLKMAPRPIHTKILQFITVNGQDFGTKRRMAQFGSLYFLCL